MAKTYTLDQVRAAEQDPSVHASALRRANLATERLKKKQGAMNALLRAGQASEVFADKLAALRELAAMLAQALHNLTPCDKGCSHCCWMPTMLTQAEADAIGAELGRAPVTPSYTLHRNEHYTGVVCPFLKKGRCSIYASRPLACRFHYSMHKNELPCMIFPGEDIIVPHFNVATFHKATVTVLGPKAGYELADLRDFFPAAP